MKTDVRKSVEELLLTTDLLLTAKCGATDGGQLRGAAIALRTAVELAVDAFLEGAVPGLSKVTMRAKMLCLPGYAHSKVARRARTTWSHLCLACHYHQYEIGPTREQVGVWRDEVGALVRVLAP